MALSPIPEPGFYYHYKHDPSGPFNVHAYEIVAFGRHSEDDSLVVLYRPLYINEHLGEATYFVRPLDMFGDVTKDGETFPRFAKITDPYVIEKLQDIKDQMYPAK